MGHGEASLRCPPYKPLSVLTGVRNKRVILEKIYELFVGMHETVRNIGVSMEPVSTVLE